MNWLLTILTVLEVVIFLAALVYYLVRITRLLRHISENLGKVAFGVRAIETQTAVIAPGVSRVNDQLDTVAGALEESGELARR